METLLDFRWCVVKIKQMVDMVVFVYKLFSIHHWRPALLSLEPSNSSVWIDAAGIGYPKILSEFPAELEPSFQFTFTCFLQPASHLTIYFLLCCKTCSSYHDAPILGQHIFRLGKNVQPVLSYFYPSAQSWGAYPALTVKRIFGPAGEVASSWNLSLWQSQLKSWVGLSRAHWTGKSVGASRMSNRLQTYRTCPSKKQQKCAMKGEGSTKQNQLRILRFGWVSGCFGQIGMFCLVFNKKKLKIYVFLTHEEKSCFLVFTRGWVGARPKLRIVFFFFCGTRPIIRILINISLKNLRSTGQPWLWG